MTDEKRDGKDSVLSSFNQHEALKILAGTLKTKTKDLLSGLKKNLNGDVQHANLSVLSKAITIICGLKKLLESPLIIFNQDSETIAAYEKHLTSQTKDLFYLPVFSSVRHAQLMRVYLTECDALRGRVMPSMDNTFTAQEVQQSEARPEIRVMIPNYKPLDEIQANQIDMNAARELLSEITGVQTTVTVDRSANASTSRRLECN